MRDSAPGRSKKKIHAANQKKRIQLKKEIEIRIERQEKEDEIEQERRNDMIRQIRVSALGCWVKKGTIIVWAFPRIPSL